MLRNESSLTLPNTVRFTTFEEVERHWSKLFKAGTFLRRNPYARAMNAKVKIYFRRKLDAKHASRVVDFKLC